LEDAENELWLSPISVWEALVLHAKRRVSLAGELSQWVAKSTANFSEAPLTFGIARATHDLGFAHRDPADRFLVATAKVLDLTLVTADERLLGLGEIKTLANR
jgi:PIN domain nuclease of toxin-antitoxin system